MTGTITLESIDMVGRKGSFKDADDAFDAECELLEKVVATINRLKPAFVCLCGDMIDMAPVDYVPGSDPKQEEERAKTLADLFARYNGNPKTYGYPT